jgi:geranylgeranyl pyrophosphate synthase
MADKYFKDAVNALEAVPSPGREDLLAYTNFIKNREY